MIFGLLGLILGLVGAFWRSERVRVIDGPVRTLLMRSALRCWVSFRGTPRTRRRPLHPFSRLLNRQRQQYQFIAASLALSSPGESPEALLVTSPEGGKASSITALNLALSAAQDKRPADRVDFCARRFTLPGRRRR